MTFTGGDVRPPDFIRWMRLPSGRPPRLDWFGANPYPFRFPDLADRPVAGGWRDLGDLDTLATKSTPPTDRSASTPASGSPSSPSRAARTRATSNTTSARPNRREWLRAGYDGGRRGREPSPASGWFTLLDRPTADGAANWGLMTADGAPKPAFSAYASILGR